MGRKYAGGRFLGRSGLSVLQKKCNGEYRAGVRTKDGVGVEGVLVLVLVLGLVLVLAGAGVGVEGVLVLVLAGAGTWASVWG